MPSSPKIKKDDMLQAALELVSKNGYAALNIKAVARELGCSTAPISWQFGGMDGLREELIPFAEQYVEDKYYSRNENELATFEQKGKGTIDLALENPNLFRFLYMGERSQLLSIGFKLQTNNQDAANMYQEMTGQMKAVVTDKWILCPVCGAKTRTQILDDTELKHFPLFCPKCKENFIINVKDHIVDYQSIARR